MREKTKAEELFSIEFNKALFYLISSRTSSVASLRDSLKFENIVKSILNHSCHFLVHCQVFIDPLYFQESGTEARRCLLCYAFSFCLNFLQHSYLGGESLKVALKEQENLYLFDSRE